MESVSLNILKEILKQFIEKLSLICLAVSNYFEGDWLKFSSYLQFTNLFTSIDPKDDTILVNHEQLFSTLQCSRDSGNGFMQEKSEMWKNQTSRNVNICFVL